MEPVVNDLTDWSFSWQFFLLLAGGGFTMGLVAHYVGVYFWGWKRFYDPDER